MCVYMYMSHDTHMLSPGITEELKQVTSWHQLHYDIYRVILQTEPQHFHYVLMIEVTMATKMT